MDEFDRITQQAEKFADWVCERTHLLNDGLKERFIGSVIAKLDLGRQAENAIAGLNRAFSLQLGDDAVREYRRTQGRIKR